MRAAPTLILFSADTYTFLTIKIVLGKGFSAGRYIDSSGVIFARNSISIISIFFKAYIDIFKSILEPMVHRSPGACLIYYVVQK